MRGRVYRNLFIAQLGSNIGSWMQSVAAQWFLVEKHSSDVIVALVQTASLAPTLFLGLLAGALADLFDRRRLLIALQTYAVLVALALAVLTYLGRLGPTALLMFTLAIGCGSALTGPAWQAIQPETVPREQIPAASTLGSVSGNAARAVGPAIGGVVVALAGPAAVFAINAVSFAGIIVALLAWKRPKQLTPLEREHFGHAIMSGLLFVNNSPIFRRILLRAAFFPVSRIGRVCSATIHYRVPAESLEDFTEAMRAVRQSRLRTGGHSWRLYHSVGRPDTFLERFTVTSWTEFERQRTERWLDYDHDGVAKARSYTVDSDRQQEYYLALRLRR